MTPRRLRIAMNGVTGRMGRTQHLARSILAIRDEGGVTLADGTVVVPEPVLLGRDPDRLRALAERSGVRDWSTDVAGCLADESIEVYFDAQVTARRVDAVRAAIDAGKHVYCEKPLAEHSAEAADLADRARRAGVKHGVVADKLYLPGVMSLVGLVESGFFGRLLTIRGEFGYWVFEGHDAVPQRPSWNYRAADGGSIVTDMLCHWEYLVAALAGRVTRVFCHGATHVPRRVDERGREYQCTADDAAYAMFETERGVVVQINSSWAVRVHREELLELQLDGTAGSAVGGLWTCRVQPRALTPRAVWNPDEPDPLDHRAGWMPVPRQEPAGSPPPNAFRAQWERFLAHVVGDEPYELGFDGGTRGVRLAELGMRSWREGRWIDVPPGGPAPDDGGSR
ncbi:MAG: Gfo/Idh/MocA family protein [Kineosporiaceae bacterium]